MDPFLELYGWGDFHVSLIVEFKRQLTPQISPKYAAIAERRVYLEHHDDRSEFIPDVHIAESAAKPMPPASANPLVATLEPETHMVPMPLEVREPFLEIRDLNGNEVVTVIEVLSPTNKRAGTDGSVEYQSKREEILRSSANLVEIDLLRGGERPILKPPVRTTSDYVVSVHRKRKRPSVDVYQWSLRRQLPEIPIPLAGNDSDVTLDLQKALNDIWDYSGYANQVQYSRSLVPPARSEDEAWIKEIISKVNHQQ
jgi:hypothetical protein